MSLTKVKEYVEENQLLLAIEEIDGESKEVERAKFHLKQRLNALSDDLIKGIVSNEDAMIERNKIVQAILHYAEKYCRPIGVPPYTPMKVKKNVIKLSTEISKLYDKYRRTNLSDSLAALYKEAYDYEGKKILDKHYDPLGEEYMSINKKFETVKTSIKNYEITTRATRIEEINRLIEEGTYNSLRIAVVEIRNLESRYKDECDQVLKDMELYKGNLRQMASIVTRIDQLYKGL